jgi:hypothetical protein
LPGPMRDEDILYSYLFSFNCKLNNKSNFRTEFFASS